ncbi:MAG TPA: transposase, partial [Acetobacteraceae bacterium]|nr:transposase [Acetobacteraceae bacterium]
WLTAVHGRLRRLPPIPGRPASPARRTGAFPRSRAERAASAESRARWKALHDEVRRRIATGEPLLSIGRRMGLARGTVRKFADAESFPERAVRPPGPSILDPHLAYLEARLAAGCENAMALWCELRGRGFSGTARQVHRWLSPRRTTWSKRTPQREGGASPAAPSRGVCGTSALPSPKQLAWHLTRPRDRLTDKEGEAVARLEQDPEAVVVAGLVRRFADLLRGCCVGAKARCDAPITVLEGWLTDAKESGVAAVTTFATGLRQDGAAVKAAFTTSWSSGQTEGQVGKLKMLKRQTFGRSGFDLLRRRVLLAA